MQDPIQNTLTSLRRVFGKIQSRFISVAPSGGRYSRKYISRNSIVSTTPVLFDEIREKYRHPNAARRHTTAGHRSSFFFPLTISSTHSATISVNLRLNRVPHPSFSSTPISTVLTRRLVLVSVLIFKIVIKVVIARLAVRRY